MSTPSKEPINPAVSVGKPVMPHEVTLQYLSEQEIAEGTWTVKQMFHYLSYKKNYENLPDSEPSIYIPIEYSHITKYRISCNFRAQKFGKVRKVGLVSHCNKSCDDCAGKMFNKVFVHFESWKTYYKGLSTIEQHIDDFIAENEHAIRTRFALITGKTINLYYDVFDKATFVKIMALKPEHFHF